MWAACLVWAGDVAEEEPEEEDDQLGNLDEEEIKKMQSDEVLLLLSVPFLFCFLLLFYSGLQFSLETRYSEWRLISKCKGE